MKAIGIWVGIVAVLVMIAPANAVSINELRIDQGGGDTDEYWAVLAACGEARTLADCLGG